MTNKKRRIIRIEDITRPKTDFLTKPKIGYTEIRARYAGKKIERSLEDNLRYYAREKNHCFICHNQAAKLIYLAIKGGGLLLEKYCDQCFDKVIDVEKMEVRKEVLDKDAQILDNITLKQSPGAAPRHHLHLGKNEK